jgi:hypothetical protein
MSMQIPFASECFAGKSIHYIAPPRVEMGGVQDRDWVYRTGYMCLQVNEEVQDKWRRCAGKIRCIGQGGVTSQGDS